MRISIAIIGVFLLNTTSLFGQVFINEISYKDLNASDRGVEIAGPAGTNLNGWYMEFKDNNNTLYHTEVINSPTTIDNENASGKGGVWFPVADLHSNDNRTIILYDNTNVPQDTVSYGSPFPNFVGSNIGIVQSLPATTPQNIEDGNNNGTWWILATATKGDLNSGQLPVELISFTAKILETNIILDWVTASEENNSHFEIERSSDGFTYERIGIIDGNGTTFETQTYDFTDFQIQEGRYYYRLKQVDFDHQFEYSKVISVDYFKQSLVALTPNPIKSNGILNISLSMYENTDFIIYNLAGKIVRTYYDIGKNDIIINGLDRGIYIYQIRQNQLLLKTDKLIIID